MILYAALLALGAVCWPAGFAWASEVALPHAEAAAALPPPLWSLIPFGGLLLSIALCPLISQHLWERHYGKVSLFWILAGVIGMFASYPAQASFGDYYGTPLFLAIEEYISFIILLGSLFIIAGGVRIEQDAPATPLVNTVILLIGSVLANLVGTTGAAMLLIRPLLWINERRRYRVHVVLFFIFIVCNIGGALTPIGDPPLFVGFLRGVPFTWTLRLLPHWAFTVGLTLLVFFLVDLWLDRREKSSALHAHEPRGRADPYHDLPERALVFRLVPGMVRVYLWGWPNLLLLLGVIAGVLWSGLVHLEWSLNVFGLGQVHGANLFRDLFLVGLALCSLKISSAALRERNQFRYEPMREVALLFIGIFITMVPALMLLNAKGSEWVPLSPLAYLWMTGLLSALLDNTPTYLSFLSTAMGALEVDSALELSRGEFSGLILEAISIGAVFFGALTYIGNGPNFMVRTIAQQHGLRMPSFITYFFIASVVLMPIYVLVSWIFFTAPF